MNNSDRFFIGMMAVVVAFVLTMITVMTANNQRRIERLESFARHGITLPPEK